MNRLYKRTFDQIHMSEKAAQDLRAELVARSTHSETEENSMNKHHALRRPTTFLVAAILIASMTVSALACGGYVVYKIISADEIPEDAFLQDLTEQTPDFEFHEYQYTEQNGQIYVELDEVQMEETSSADTSVTYQSVNGIDTAENRDSIDLTEQAPDFEFQNYNYTEENGEIRVDFDGVDGID